MADTLTTQSATPATIPASTVIATDDAGAGGHVQVVKLAVSTNGSATPLTADNTDGLLVNLGANNDVTVTGTVTANLAAGTNNIGDVDVVSSALPTGASTLAEQQSQTTHLATIAGDTTDIETAVELLDDTVATLGTTTYSEATTKGLIIGAVRRDADTTLVDTTNEVGPVQMNAAGQLKVEVFSGETLPVSLTSTTVTGTVAVTQSGTWDEVGINDSGNSITVDNNGTFATQSTLQAGTNAVGKLLPPDIDVTAHTNYAKKYYTSTGAATDGIIWSPAAGKRWHVVSMYINVSAAATVTLEDDKAGGDEAVWKGEYAANSGVTIYFGEKYPLASGEDAADLLITTSAGNCYVTVTGYEV